MKRMILSVLLCLTLFTPMASIAEYEAAPVTTLIEGLLGSPLLSL